MSDRSRIIALTGGIASGKTTIANYIHQRYGLATVDADALAREAVAPGSPILDRLAERWGDEVLTAEGSLNRRRVGEIVFNNEEERRWLEAQIHPYVRQRFEGAIAAARAASTSLLLVVPLLFEAGMEDLADDIWVAYCTEEQQRQRLMARNNLDRPAAEARIAAQRPLSEKCDRADVVLDNRGDRRIWQQQVDAELLE